MKIGVCDTSNKQTAKYTDRQTFSISKQSKKNLKSHNSLAIKMYLKKCLTDRENILSFKLYCLSKEYFKHSCMMKF